MLWFVTNIQSEASQQRRTAKAQNKNGFDTGLTLHRCYTHVLCRTLVMLIRLRRDTHILNPARPFTALAILLKEQPYMEGDCNK